MDRDNPSFPRLRRELPTLTVLTAIALPGELTIAIHGRSDLVTGSLKVPSDPPIGGVPRFNLPGVEVVGVGVS